jgi:hypothetical protein
MEKLIDDGMDEAGKPLEPIETSGLGIYEDHLMNLPPVVVGRFNMTYERFMSEGAPETPLIKAKMWNMPELLCPYCNELARRKILQDGAHEEVFILFASDEENGQLAFVQPPQDMDRGSFLRMLRNSIREQDVQTIVHIAELWLHESKGPDDPTSRKISEGKIRVSQLKDGDKTEALVVNVVCRGGAEYAYYNYILRAQDGIALADPAKGSCLQFLRTLFEGSGNKGSL